MRECVSEGWRMDGTVVVRAGNRRADQTQWLCVLVAAGYLQQLQAAFSCA